MITPPPGDSTQHLVIGWKEVDDEKWWRTGSLEGTVAVLARQANGLSWAFITNTGTYRGPYFSYEVAGLMRRQLPLIRKWPRWDLMVLANP
ncbi:MAG: hypothetical protein HC913_08960 [Microscillaceae bacterium]|nr:hypothetical protein [Microscillaceae bacterium]